MSRRKETHDPAASQGGAGGGSAGPPPASADPSAPSYDSSPSVRERATPRTPSVEHARRPHVIIVGGGFGGLYAAQSLRRAPLDVTLIDRRNFHLFQPLLYQVATGGLSPANIAAPLRAVLARQRNTRVLLGEVVDILPDEHALLLADGERLTYDYLIVATGSRHNYFGHDAWEPLAPGLKTIEDATEIRRRILSAFEQAERTSDPAELRALLTFCVIGAGPTGVELAGALAEIARYTLQHEFRRIDPAQARILLIEGAERVLPPFPPELSRAAERSLARLGVTVRRQTMVTDVGPQSITVRCGEAQETIPTRTVLWAAGVAASPLGRVLSQRTGVELDRAGRVRVAPDCSVPGAADVFVIGDLAMMNDEAGKPLPGIAPVAMQQGAYVARVICRRAAGGSVLPPFHYFDKGMLATIGRARAVADIFGVRFSGYLAWLTWLFVHLMFLIEFQNRVLVMLQWAWNYFTWSRSARLITNVETRRSAPSTRRSGDARRPGRASRKTER